jgi:hypothetical protein
MNSDLQHCFSPLQNATVSQVNSDSLKALQKMGQSNSFVIDKRSTCPDLPVPVSQKLDVFK